MTQAIARDNPELTCSLYPQCKAYRFWFLCRNYKRCYRHRDYAGLTNDEAAERSAAWAEGMEP